MKIGMAGVVCVYLIFTRQCIDQIKETRSSSSQLAAACNNSVTVFVKLVTTNSRRALSIRVERHVENPSSLFEAAAVKRECVHAVADSARVAFIFTGREQIPLSPAA